MSLTPLETFLHISSHISQERQLEIAEERLLLNRDAAKRDERKLELYELRAAINVQEFIDQEIRSVYELFKSDKEQIEFMLTNWPAERAFGKLMIWIMFEYRKTQPIDTETLYVIAKYATIPQMKQVIQTYVDEGDVVGLLQNMASPAKKAKAESTRRQTKAETPYKTFEARNMPERSKGGDWEPILWQGAILPATLLTFAERFLPIKKAKLEEKYPSLSFETWDSECVSFLNHLRILSVYAPDMPVSVPTLLRSDYHLSNLAYDIFNRELRNNKTLLSGSLFARLQMQYMPEYAFVLSATTNADKHKWKSGVIHTWVNASWPHTLYLPPCKVRRSR